MSGDQAFRVDESSLAANPFRSPDPAVRSATPLAVLAILVALAGAAGMLISSVYLFSLRPADLFGGVAGFVAGAVFIVGGLIALAVLSRSPATSETVTQALAALLVFVPPLVVMIAWPVLYFSFFIIGYVLVQVVALVAMAFAWPISRIAADNLTALASGQAERRASLLLVISLFVCQVAMILATWPAWIMVFQTLEAMGLKMGWS